MDLRQLNQQQIPMRPSRKPPANEEAFGEIFQIFLLT